MAVVSFMIRIIYIFMLFQVALLLGVEFHEGVSFEGLLEPSVSNNAESKFSAYYHFN